MDKHQDKTNQRKTENDEQSKIEQENIASKDQRKCANCDWCISETADICENCNEWLLKATCCFCYGDIEDGQKFCSECGNSPTGITCQSCGKLSYFDFCKNCCIPLTEQANETIEAVKISSEFQNILTILQQPDNENVIQTSSLNFMDEVKKMNNYIAKTNQAQVQKKKFQLFKNDNSPDIDKQLLNIQKAQKAQNEEQKKQDDKRQNEELALQQLEETKRKKFNSNQEARRFFGALKILIPQVVQFTKRILIGWRCNFADVTHPDGPQDCGDPSEGGNWVYETETKTRTDYKQLEI